MPRGSKSGQVRAGGHTQADEVAEEQGAALTEPVEDRVLPEERDRGFDFTGFSRMRTSFSSGDRAMMDRIRSTVDGVILQHFSDAYSLMNDLFDVVRDQASDDNGVAQFDQWGFPVWVRLHSGAYAEDWSRLTYRQREDFLYRVTTSLFEWEQRAADLWGESMFAKAIWQERFSHEYDRPHTGTIEDRTAVANVRSAEDKYFAILASLLSKKADAVVRSMTLLGQRLRDTSGS